MQTKSESREVAERVRAAADAAGYDAAGIAEVLGRPMTTTYRRLNGTTPFTVAELRTIAGALGVPVSALVDGGPAITIRSEPDPKRPA